MTVPTLMSLLGLQCDVRLEVSAFLKWLKHKTDFRSYQVRRLFQGIQSAFIFRPNTWAVIYSAVDLGFWL